MIGCICNVLPIRCPPRSLTANENLWLHGWEGVGGQAGCRDHQDWCSWETIVLAFSISRDGVRAMAQLTMRVRGYGRSQAFADYLRANMFGEEVSAE
jgi:hypothetical protein